MQHDALPEHTAADPLPQLVEGRFRILMQCAVSERVRDDPTLAHGVDQAHRRVRRMDQQIVRTVAVSKAGLLAQLRLLSAFYDESVNGGGRRGCLLIQSIAAGVERLGSSALPYADLNEPPK